VQDPIPLAFSKDCFPELPQSSIPTLKDYNLTRFGLRLREDLPERIRDPGIARRTIVNESGIAILKKLRKAAAASIQEKAWSRRAAAPQVRSLSSMG
jgi:hypothetical protein